MKKFINLKILTALALATLLLGGCATKISKHIPSDGIMTEDKVTFPDINKTWMGDIDYPNIENLRKVSQGMDKDTIMNLIGHPQFAEGLYAVREWDYAFNLKKDKFDIDKICQFKVIFDKNYIARSFFYKPSNCENFVFNKKATASYEISADLLFPFNSFVVGENGKEKVLKIANEINKKSAKSITIIGYTDIIGNQNYNLALSKKRANAVKDIFVETGINSNIIHTVGGGKSKQVKTCDSSLNKEDLIKCLKPNRRVVINVN